MAAALFVSGVISFAWIGLHVALMHWKPAQSRIGSITKGYLISIPCLYVAWRWLPLPGAIVKASAGQEPLMGLFHAYTLHLLLYFFYVEGFYHVERAVSLRFLIEILQHRSEHVRLAEIMERYNIGEMISRRLGVLEQYRYIEKAGERWHLQRKGKIFARLMQFSSWIFQSKGQSDRLK